MKKKPFVTLEKLQEITEKYLMGIRSEAYKKTQPNCLIL